MFNVYFDDCRKGPMVPYSPGKSGPQDSNSFSIEVPDKNWVIVRRTEHLKHLLQAGLINNLMMDHDLGTDDITGYQMICWMEENNMWPHGKITVHSQNPVGKEKMEWVIYKNNKNVDK